jgi:hypothetical protein
MKAVKATVTVGHITIDGYRTEDGMFGMSTAGLGALCGFDRTHSTSKIMSNKRVKTLAAKGFETHKNVKCENMSLSLISLGWVPSILQCLAFSGHEQAQEFLMTLAGLSLQKLFCDAFGEKFETEEMQVWLQARYGAIEKRNDWTDSIKFYGETHEVSETWKRFIYINVSDRLNIALTGHPAAHWANLFDCPRSALRDHWNYRHLSNIDSVEKHATVLVLRGADPLDALNEALGFFSYPVNPEPQRVRTPAAEYKQRRRAAGKTN